MKTDHLAKQLAKRNAGRSGRWSPCRLVWQPKQAQNTTANTCCSSLYRLWLLSLCVAYVGLCQCPPCAKSFSTWCSNFCSKTVATGWLWPVLKMTSCRNCMKNGKIGPRNSQILGCFCMLQAHCNGFEFSVPKTPAHLLPSTFTLRTKWWKKLLKEPTTSRWLACMLFCCHSLWRLQTYSL